MARPAPEVDIARNIRTIEWLKTEIVTNVAALFRAIFKGSEDVVLEALANNIIASYLLARRLGLQFARLDGRVLAKARASIADGHETEKWYGDLSALLRHLEDQAR